MGHVEDVLKGGKAEGGGGTVHDTVHGLIKGRAAGAVLGLFSFLALFLGAPRMPVKRYVFHLLLDP